MFIEGNTFAAATPANADVCIVGAGAAGLPLADSLARRNISVILIESGGLVASPEADALNAGVSDQASYPFIASRARVFGGTTTKWTGACVPLERADFMKRDWLRHSGWPIGPTDLATYYSDAMRIFGYSDNPAFVSKVTAKPFHGGALESFPVYYGNPLSFSDIYAKKTDQDKTIKCVLNSTVSGVRLNASATQVSQLDVYTSAGRQFQVNARHFVLATGGLENARILLASSAHPGQGVLNAHDLVGRYHMEHPIRTIAVLDLAAPLNDALVFTNRQQISGTTAQGSFGLSAEIREREHLLNAHIRTYRYHTLEDEAAIIAGKAAMQKMQHTHKFSEFSQYVRKYGAVTGKQVLPYLLWHSWNKINPRAQIKHLRFTAFLEQEPDPENRVTLSSKTDVFSNRLPHLSFSESDFMQQGVLRSMEMMAKTFARSGIGTLRFQPEDIAHLHAYDSYGLHHMGATRMSDTAGTGVTDKNCTVHGVSNLHVAGSSLFPTGGAANPTLTIVALSLRQADHLYTLMTTN